MRRKRWFGLLAGLSVVALTGCEYPTDPIPTTAGTGPVVTPLGVIKGLMYPNQICNPSISQDVVRYPGCMLWLNFSGNLSVNVPPQWSSIYVTAGAQQHDRLSVTSYDDSLRWFLMRDSVPEIRGHMQDPEWTTHPDYIAFLGSMLGSNAPGSWNGYVVRTTDKQVLRLDSAGMDEQGTPHVWIGSRDAGDSAAPAVDVVPAGFASRTAVWSYFGTTNVKFSFSTGFPGLTISFVDYSMDTVKLVSLPRPASKSGANMESGMISPDGGFITYNCWTDPNVVSSYVQRLEDGSSPILVSEPGNDPRWWRFNGRDYLLYATPGKLLTLEPLETDTTFGSTMRQEVELAPEGPRYIQFRTAGEATTLLKYPFKGGLSPDGFYACTGYKWAYMFKFN
jgi:hypothetical protein